MPMCQGKTAYPTEHDAQVVLVGCIIRRNRGRQQRKERRAYQCPACHQWHLTSKPYKPKEPNQ